MPNFDDQIAFNLPGETKQAAQQDLDHGELSEELRGFVRELAFGEDVSERERLQQRLDSIREEKDELRKQRRHLDAEIADLESEESRLEERVNNLTSRQEQYEASLEMLEEILGEGGRVDPGHGQVKRAAMIGEREPEDVIEDLKERNPSVPDHAFVEAIHARKEWTGTN